MTRVSILFISALLLRCGAQLHAMAPEAVAECMASHIIARERGGASLAGIQIGSPIEVVADVCRLFRGIYSCQAQCADASVVAWASHDGAQVGVVKVLGKARSFDAAHAMWARLAGRLNLVSTAPVNGSAFPWATPDEVSSDAHCVVWGQGQDSLGLSIYRDVSGDLTLELTSALDNERCAP